MALPLDGPRLPPAAGGAPRQLVVFLPGYGADGNDLIGLGREWAKLLPHAAFVSPHAPEPCGAAPMGRQWFNLTFRDASELVRGVKQASPALEAFLDAELKRHNLPARSLALVGFSQGTMMALGVGLKRQPAPAAIVGYSGALATVEALPKDPGSAPAILLVPGDMGTASYVLAGTSEAADLSFASSCQGARRVASAHAAWRQTRGVDLPNFVGQHAPI